MIYIGPIYAWTRNQTAIAAAEYPGYPPTQDGVDMLQQRWRDAGHEPLRNVRKEPRDMSFAIEAFKDIARRNPTIQYEQQIA